MVTKNPFVRGGRPTTTTTPASGGGKPTINPFDRSKSASKAVAKGPPRSSFAMMKSGGGKSSLEKLKELAEKRRAGLVKAAPAKKMVAAPEAPRSNMAAAGSAAPTASSTPAPAPRSALGGASSMGTSSSSRNSWKKDDKPSSLTTNTGKSGTSSAPTANSSNGDVSVTVVNSSMSTRYSAFGGDTSNAAPADPTVPAMTSENYTKVYQEQTLGMTGAASQTMTSENYQEVYQNRSENFTGEAAQQMTSENYMKVYQKQEEQRAVQKAQQQIIKQQEAAIIETRKQMQQNATLAHQAQGLYAKLAHLRGSLGSDPDQNNRIHGEIADVERAIAQIPAGLR